MTRAEFLAEARIAGWHRAIERWRELTRQAIGVASVEHLRRAYVEGSRFRAAGGACGCSSCSAAVQQIQIGEAK